MNRKAWTDAEVQRLIELYPDMPTKEVAEILGRPLGGVNGKAYLIGLNKSAEYMARVKPGQLDGKRGASHRFKKGQKPWNKGKQYKAGGRSVETQFKKGGKPHTWKPIGTERITKDGIRQRKVTDTGYAPNDWQSVHQLLWEEHHGPVPEGHVVVFRNRDREDIRIDNLELVTRAELCDRNSIHRYPTEIKQAMRALGKLKKGIRQQQEQCS